MNRKTANIMRATTYLQTGQIQGTHRMNGGNVVYSVEIGGGGPVLARRRYIQTYIPHVQNAATRKRMTSELVKMLLKRVRNHERAKTLMTIRRLGKNGNKGAKQLYNYNYESLRKIAMNNFPTLNNATNVLT
jgi:hypothetical protein